MYVFNILLDEFGENPEKNYCNNRALCAIVLTRNLQMEKENVTGSGQLKCVYRQRNLDVTEKYTNNA